MIAQEAVSAERQEFENAFPQSQISHWSEGGVSFYRIENFNLISGVSECIFQIGKYLGYESRIFYPKILETKVKRNWNSKNVLIDEKTYFAFSYRAPEGSLLDVFMIHLEGAL